MDIDNDTDEDHDDGDDNELEDEDNKNNNKSESSTWVKALVMTLLGHEKPVNAVVSLVDAMKVRFFSLSYSRVTLKSLVCRIYFGEEFVFVSGF